MENFSPYFLPLWWDKNKIKLLYGSRNSTKSHYAAIQCVLKSLTLPYHKVLMVRKIKESVADSVYGTVKEVIEMFGLTKFFHFSDNRSRITCRINGNQFIPKGTHETLNQSGTAKSIVKPTAAIVDEMDELTEPEFNKLLFSLRGSEHLELFGIFNTDAVDENHWIYQKWFPENRDWEKEDGSHLYVRSKVSNTTIMHSTYKNNPFITKANLEEFENLKKTNPDLYDVTGKGLLRQTKPSNPCFPSFDKGQHVTDTAQFNPRELALAVWDFNVRPHHTVGIWQFSEDYANKVFYCDLVKEFCLPATAIRGVQKEINSYLYENGYQSNRIRLIADYSGNKQSDHDVLSDIAKIKAEAADGGYSVSDETKVNPSVSSTMSFVNEMLAGRVKYDDMTIVIRIHPDCKYHIEDFAKCEKDKYGKVMKTMHHEYVIRGGQKVKISYQKRGHAVDGVRYMAYANFNYEYNEFIHYNKDDYYDQ